MTTLFTTPEQATKEKEKEDVRKVLCGLDSIENHTGEFRAYLETLENFRNRLFAPKAKNITWDIAKPILIESVKPEHMDIFKSICGVLRDVRKYNFL